jgi:hypothetical protein
VSAISVRDSWLKSSTTAMIRKRRPSTKASDTRSRPHRWFGRNGIAIGIRVARAVLAVAVAAYLQPFLAVEAAELLVVHDQTLAAQHMQTAMAEPSVDGGRFAQASPVCRHVGRLLRSRTDVRSTPSAFHARSSLISKEVRR